MNLKLKKLQLPSFLKSRLRKQHIFTKKWRHAIISVWRWTYVFQSTYLVSFALCHTTVTLNYEAGFLHEIVWKRVAKEKPLVPETYFDSIKQNCFNSRIVYSASSLKVKYDVCGPFGCNASSSLKCFFALLRGSFIHWKELNWGRANQIFQSCHQRCLISGRVEFQQDRILGLTLAWYHYHGPCHQDRYPCIHRITCRSCIAPPKPSRSLEWQSSSSRNLNILSKKVVRWRPQFHIRAQANICLERI